MYLIAPNIARIGIDGNRNVALREYGRMEYGTPDVTWIAASARVSPFSGRARRRRPPRSLGRRLLYFLNSFRGFAAFDIRGTDDTRSD